MTVEGITLTPAMIDNIKWLQDNPGVMNDHLNKFDQVIAYVANENDSADQETAAKALKLISMLCYIKGIYQTLEGKE
ncbi:hypothetical protein AAA214_05800 [Parabacteroides goldsteinii]|uniref:hypothetical protein n=1 Tax=Parabacteroides goldsteinii TaxID=328812 RepID=UPI00321A4DC2